MPRNASGAYSLPAGNPVVTGTTITSTWANGTLTDVASELTNSLDRQGRGSMLAPLKLTDGTIVAPGAVFSSELTTGLARPSGGNVTFSILASEVMRWSAGAVTVTGTLAVTGTTIFTGAPSYAADPVSANQLARKSYVDGMAFLKLDGTTSMLAGIRGFAGLVATPGYTFVGDLDNGWWSPGADIQAWSTAGVTRMQLGATGLLSLTAGGQVLTLEASAGATTHFAYVHNTSNLAGANAAVVIGVGGTGAGDPSVRFDVDSGAIWSLGTDNSDGDNFKLSLGVALGTGDIIVVRPTGGIGFGAAPNNDFSVIRATAVNADLTATGAADAYWNFRSSSATKGHIGFGSVSGEMEVGSLGCNLGLYPGGSRRVLITTSGDMFVGLGSASYGSRFAVSGGMEMTGNQFNFSPATDMEMVHRGTGGWQFYTDSAAKVPFKIERLAPTNQLVVGQASVRYGGIEVGFRGLPTASVTTGAFASSDAGKCVNATGGVTVPNATMAAGDVVVIDNQSGGAITITATITTLTLAGTATTGNRTLANNGIATVKFRSGTAAVISGSGLT